MKLALCLTAVAATLLFGCGGDSGGTSASTGTTGASTSTTGGATSDTGTSGSSTSDAGTSGATSDAGTAGGSSSGGASRSKADFIRRADIVCGKVSQESRAGLASATTTAELAKAADAAASASALGTADLRALKAPAADRAFVARWLAGTERVTKALQGLAAAARKNDTRAIRSFATKVRVASDGLRPSLQRYGFKVCGSE